MSLFALDSNFLALARCRRSDTNGRKVMSARFLSILLAFSCGTIHVLILMYHLLRHLKGSFKTI